MTASPLHIVSTGPATGLVAGGPYDELAAALLQRAGFVPVSTGRSSYWQIPEDLAPADAREIAGSAYDMLRAARYEVTIAPELRPAPAAVAREIKAMAGEIADAENLDTVIALLAPLAAPETGVLAEISWLIGHAARWTAVESACTYREGLARMVFGAAQAVEVAQGELNRVVAALSWVPEQMRGRNAPPVRAEADTHPRVTAARARSASPAGPGEQPSPPAAPASRPPAPGRRP
ncbi:hypothetical protein ACFO3J_27305 [Streptomyces polygonati]|uniref:Uncharacterized protein n=1 Tax=Streptomyces polygonati TaxID=1617087 RepID=A0ABV8HTX5_9ACTN